MASGREEPSSGHGSARRIRVLFLGANPKSTEVIEIRRPAVLPRDHVVDLVRDEREHLWKQTVLTDVVRPLAHSPAQGDRDMAHRGRSFSAALAFASRTRCSRYS
jgi:hypothetical protein